MISFTRIFFRDCRARWKQFLALFIAAAMISAIMTSAFLIGDSVRDTLLDNVSRNAKIARFRQKFNIPVDSRIQNGIGVLHVKAFTSDGIPVDVYALPDSFISSHHEISDSSGRDAWGSPALAKKLDIQPGNIIPVRMQTLSIIQSESPMGRPPELKQTPFIWRGTYHGPESGINFDDPQLPPYNLFVSRKALAQALDISPNATNEAWFQAQPIISDDILWELSGLSISDWNGYPVLKSRSYFLPKTVSDALPHDVVRILTLFVDSLSDGNTSLSYCFASAFSAPLPFSSDGASPTQSAVLSSPMIRTSVSSPLLSHISSYSETPVHPVQGAALVPQPIHEIPHSGIIPPGHIAVSETLNKDFSAPAFLSFYVADSFRTIREKNVSFEKVDIVDDSAISDVLSPDIPGLTDSSDCSGWEAALPIDFDRISDDDEEYWNKFHSKPKIYLNFNQAQEIFAPGLCTAVLFPKEYSRDLVKSEVLEILRTMPEFSRFDSIENAEKEKVANGIPFAPLFLGLSFFLILSATLVLAMLLKLHVRDRASELNILSQFFHMSQIRCFIAFEFTAAIVPGLLFGLFAGAFLCKLQIFLLEHAWNGIVLMEHIDFHASPNSFLAAFAIALIAAILVLIFSIKTHNKSSDKLSIPFSCPIKSITKLGFLSCLRSSRRNIACVLLLILGFLGTLGVGAFGIKSRGEDAFGFDFVAQTCLPVVPDYDTPFPKGGLPVRVHNADRADCSNLLAPATPTVFGADISVLTGNPAFLPDGSAAVDSGSLIWILRKRKHDTITYSNGTLSLDRILKASVFQGGILTNLHTFEKLFPESEGAQFFLIRNDADLDAWHNYLEPYGLVWSSTSDFMARAEHFQNRYLAIFLQLGLLGALLGFGALVLMILRNLRARRAEIILLSEIGWSRHELVNLFLVENLSIFLTSAAVSLLILLVLDVFTSINLAVLLTGFLFLALSGSIMIFSIVRIFFSSILP